MKPVLNSIDCLSLKVGDLPEAIEFYSVKLGHKLKWKTATAAGLEFAEGQPELVVHVEDHSSETDLLVKSVPEAIRVFTQAGGKLVAGPFDIPVGLFAILSDPWDNHLCILDLSKGTFQVDEDKNVVEVGSYPVQERA
jgi:predicted enzyme related to lactoylglutathione lyase